MMLHEPLTHALVAGHFMPRGVHLDTASVGLPPRAVSQALCGSVERWAQGELRVADFDAAIASARAAFARLVGVDSDQVVLASAASTHIGTVAAALPRGAHVLCAEGDFSFHLYNTLQQVTAAADVVRRLGD